MAEGAPRSALIHESGRHDAVCTCLNVVTDALVEAVDAHCRYGAGKVSAGANVDGAPLPEDAEEGGKEEEVGEFGFNTLVNLFFYSSNLLDCLQLAWHLY